MSDKTRRSFLKVSGAALGGIAVGSTVTVAESTERFIVDTKKFDGSTGDLTVVHELDPIDAMVVEGAESDVEALGVDYAPDTTYSLDQPMAEDTPVPAEEDATDEPLYGLQWDKQSQDVPSAHEVTRGEGTRVAVIDTGVAAGHPDLAPVVNADLSRDFTGDGYGAPGPWGGYHGTHVAGIVGADDRNDAGTVGTAPGTEIVDCRVFSPDSLASFADIVAAMVYAAEVECDAANASIGAYPVSRKAVGSFYGGLLNRATTYANSQGTLLVISAGNASADLQHDGQILYDIDDDGEAEKVPAISLPNEAANVMSISATGPIGFNWGDAGLEEAFDSPSFYTNYGTNAINVSAPGGDADLQTDNPLYYLDLVLSTIATPDLENGDHTYSWGWAAGTSMAAPQVAGAAALVKSVNPGYNANQVRSTLERTADDAPGGKEYHGAGHLSPNDAVRD